MTKEMWKVFLRAQKLCLTLKIQWNWNILGLNSQKTAKSVQAKNPPPPIPPPVTQMLSAHKPVTPSLLIKLQGLEVII